MEAFLFLLSFISGGVVLTVAYIYHLTTKTKEKQSRLVSYQQNLQTIQADQFSKYKSELESVYNKLDRIEKEMRNDGYANLTTQRKLQKTAEVRIKTLEDYLNKNREEIRENMERCMSDIQKINAWKNSVENDPNVISRY